MQQQPKPAVLQSGRRPGGALMYCSFSFSPLNVWNLTFSPGPCCTGTGLSTHREAISLYTVFTSPLGMNCLLPLLTTPRNWSQTRVQQGVISCWELENDAARIMETVKPTRSRSANVLCRFQPPHTTTSPSQEHPRSSRNMLNY